MSQLLMPKLADFSTDAPVRYFEGAPQGYRYESSKGNFNVNGEINITSTKDHLSILPLAMRHFDAPELFKIKGKQWIELFFLNEAGNVCSLNFHGFSVLRFFEIVKKKLFYDATQAQICDVIWIFKPTAKSIQKIINGETTTITFHILDFSYKLISPKLKSELQIIRDSLSLYNSETARFETLYSENYGLPLEVISELPTGEAQKE
jgi:hypothetical protein